MVTIVCRCCGELMAEKPRGFSGNPNVCAACEDQSGVLREPTIIESADGRLGSMAVDEETAEMRKAA